MPRKTERIRNHHKGIVKSLKAIVRRADTLTSRPGAAVRKALTGDIEFLRNDLTPHAEGEERGLYPEADKLIRKYGRPTATMSREHVHLKKEIATYCRLAQRIAAAKGPVPTATRTAFWKSAVRLEFLLSVHLEEEEEDLLPFFDKYLSQEEVNAVIEKMHGH
jgi:hemerythrin-like domain-containing protein